MRKYMLRSVSVGCLVIVLLLALPLTAQDDWPEECQLPDLAEDISEANDAQANGDVAAFVAALSGINRAGGEVLEDCLEAVVEANTDLSRVLLSNAHLVGLDLSGANLQEAWLWSANLERVDFTGANLQEARLNGTNLEGADLIGANLQGANLQGANLLMTDLSDADLQEANLSWTNLERANLSGANLGSATMNGADLAWADLEGATLRADLSSAYLVWANLKGANLQGAFLMGANLLYTNLTGATFDEETLLPDSTNWTADTDLSRFTDPAHPEFWRGYDRRNPDASGLDFSGANLHEAVWGSINLAGADLSEANLQQARLWYANLEGANLAGANLGGAVLRGANLQDAALTGALFDENTILPDNTAWTPGTDMSLFTDPAHPEFWRGYGHRYEDLTGTDFSGANLRGTSFEYTNLRRSDLSGANLQRAYLGSANLRGADLTGANLRGADFRGANLFDADLTGALFDENVWLPDRGKWTPDTDMARYTDPGHPDFWHACRDQSSWSIWYCENWNVFGADSPW